MDAALDLEIVRLKEARDLLASDQWTRGVKTAPRSVKSSEPEQGWPSVRKHDGQLRKLQIARLWRSIKLAPTVWFRITG